MDTRQKHPTDACIQLQFGACTWCLRAAGGLLRLGAEHSLAAQPLVHSLGLRRQISSVRRVHRWCISSMFALCLRRGSTLAACWSSSLLSTSVLGSSGCRSSGALGTGKGSRLNITAAWAGGTRLADGGYLASPDLAGSEASSVQKRRPCTSCATKACGGPAPARLRQPSSSSEEGSPECLPTNILAGPVSLHSPCSDCRHLTTCFALVASRQSTSTRRLFRWQLPGPARPQRPR